MREAIAKAEDRVRELESDSSDRKRNEVISGAIDIVGGLLSGKKTGRGILGGVRRASSRRRTSSNAKNRLDSAKNRLEEKMGDLDELAETLTDNLEDARDQWDTAAEAIEEFDVGLEKADISVEDFVLIWIPTP